MSHHTNKETVVIKVIVLGSANVGKTALIERYCSQKYSAKRNPTIGSDFRTKILEIHDTEVVLQVWDTAVLKIFMCTVTIPMTNLASD
jgi:small GTP-binding protein